MRLAICKLCQWADVVAAFATNHGLHPWHWIGG